MVLGTNERGREQNGKVWRVLLRFVIRENRERKTVINSLGQKCWILTNKRKLLKKNYMALNT